MDGRRRDGGEWGRQGAVFTCALAGRGDALTDNSVGFPAIHDDESAPNAPLDGSEAAQVNNIRYLALDREGRR